MAKIIVIGAGISGVAAAKELINQGHEVILVEARDRIGGRIHTVQTHDHFPVDLGAMYVHGVGAGFGPEAEGEKVNPTVPLLAQTKAKLVKVDEDSVSLFDSRGKEIGFIQKMMYFKGYYEKASRVFSDALTKAFQKQSEASLEMGRLKLEKMQKIGKETQESFARTLSLLSKAETQEIKEAKDKEEQLRQRLLQEQSQLMAEPTDSPFPSMAEALGYRDDNIPKVDSEAFWIRKMATSQVMDNGASLENLSTFNYFNRSGYEGDDHLVVGGYGELVNLLFQQAQSTGKLTLLLESPVTQVSYGTNTTPFIVTNGNKRIEADAIICTLPIGVLKSNQVEFLPALSKEKQTAIDNLGLGFQNKVVLEFDKPFWDKSANYILPGHENVNLWLEYLNLYHFSGKKTCTLIASFYGDNALFKDKDIKQITEMALQPLRLAYGKKFTEPKKVTVTNWHQDPFSLCTWTVRGPKTTSADLTNILKPEQALFFAGEHTGNGIQSVYGAYKTGLRSARETGVYLSAMVVSGLDSKENRDLTVLVTPSVSVSASASESVSLADPGTANLHVPTFNAVRNNETGDRVESTGTAASAAVSVRTFV